MASHQTRQDPRDDAKAADRRLEILARLVRSTVHQANNSLAVLRGLLDVARVGAAGALVPERDPVLALEELLAALSHVTRAPTSKRSTFDLADPLERARLLLAPLARDLSADLHWGPADRGRIVDADPLAVQQVLTFLVADRILAGSPSLRLSVRLDAEVCRVQVVFLEVNEASPSLVEAFRARAAAWGFALGERRLGRAAVYRLVFALESGPVPDVLPGRKVLGRILVAHHDVGERELVGTVLREGGYQVVSPAEGKLQSALEEQAFDLMLLDAELEVHEPSLYGSLRERPRVPVALIGSTAPQGRPNLDRPLRPSALLSFVGAALGAAGVVERGDFP